jgi:DNA-binding transcriptional LysR family regulator
MSWKLTSRSDVEETIHPRGAISADDISFLKKAVLAGGGIALLPSFLVPREEQSGKLARVLADWRLAGSVLHVVYPSARYVPLRVVAFRDYLVRELAKISTRCEEAIALRQPNRNSS